jgi:hypothetical protein
MTSATDNPLRLKRRAEEHLDRVMTPPSLLSLSVPHSAATGEGRGNR